MNKRAIGLVLAASLVILIIIVQQTFQWHKQHPSQETLRQDIVQEKGFRVLSQQPISARFEFKPEWIPTKNGTKNVIHKVFYQNHNTSIYVDYVSRTSDGNVQVYINSSVTYSKDGGSFVTPIVWKDTNHLTSISWGNVRSPIFTNTVTHTNFTINDESGSGPFNELMFGVRAEDVTKYFSTPVIVTIPDLNLVSYAPN